MEWDDCLKYGFLSAGQDLKFNESIKSLEIGDSVVAYLKRHGYVGIGRIIDRSVCINDFRFEGKTLHLVDLKAPDMFENSDNDFSEYLVRVDWIKAVDRTVAKWKSNSGLFITQQKKAS